MQLHSFGASTNLLSLLREWFSFCECNFNLPIPWRGEGGWGWEEDVQWPISNALDIGQMLILMSNASSTPPSSPAPSFTSLTSQLVSLHVITDGGQCHWSDQTMVKKIVGFRRRVARGPWWSAYWNQTFSEQADPLLLLLLTLLSVDTARTFCSCQAGIPSFAPPPSCNQLPCTRLVCSAGNQSGKLQVRGACTIPSPPSFAMTSNFLCKSLLSSCATKILRNFLSHSLNQLSFLGPISK